MPILICMDFTSPMESAAAAERLPEAGRSCIPIADHRQRRIEEIVRSEVERAFTKRTGHGGTQIVERHLDKGALAKILARALVRLEVGV